MTDLITLKAKYLFNHQPRLLETLLTMSLADSHIAEAVQEVKACLPTEIKRLRDKGNEEATEAADKMAAFNAFLGEWFVDD